MPSCGLKSTTWVLVLFSSGWLSRCQIESAVPQKQPSCSQGSAGAVALWNCCECRVSKTPGLMELSRCRLRWHRSCWTRTWPSSSTRWSWPSSTSWPACSRSTRSKCWRLLTPWLWMPKTCWMLLIKPDWKSASPDRTKRWGKSIISLGILLATGCSFTFHQQWGFTQRSPGRPLGLSHCSSWTEWLWWSRAGVRPWRFQQLRFVQQPWGTGQSLQRTGHAAHRAATIELPPATASEPKLLEQQMGERYCEEFGETSGLRILAHSIWTIQTGIFFIRTLTSQYANHDLQRKNKKLYFQDFSHFKTN